MAILNRGTRIFLSAVSVIVLTQGYAQDGSLIPYRKGNLWGYSDPAGKLVVAPSYERTFFFSPDGLARIKQRGLYGYINREGKLVVIPQYSNAGDFFLGVAEVEKQKRKFCINLDGDTEECNAPNQDEPSEEDEFQPLEVFRDSTGKSALIFGQSGDTLSQRFDRIILQARYYFPRRNYFALVSDNKRWGAYNENGMQIAPIEFDGIDILDVRSFRALKGMQWGVLGFHGETIIPFAYDSIAKATDVQSGAEGIARREHYIVGKENQFGIIDDKGKVILPVSFDGIHIPKPCNCPLEFVVIKAGLWGLVDGEGKTVLPMRYTFVSPFGGSDYTMVRDARGREGYVSREGKEFFED